MVSSIPLRRRCLILLASGAIVSFEKAAAAAAVFADDHLPECDSERPNSWATHRTLTIPESCLSGSAAEAAAAEALCCVYTHVVVGSGGNGAAILETYDGSLYRIGDGDDDDGDDDDGCDGVRAMEEVMGRVCGMSMGSRDCFDQAACIENAEATLAPSAVPTTANETETTPTVETEGIQETEEESDGEEEEDWEEDLEDFETNSTQV
eukprot:CAMPEP_0197176344 /NCGR_PEP_ID=MMETSP1423-20130617/2312_1 /TAXON_ID=476441 /ORGANISM="Pseudo-nitzschia heimii, Strain UNC1101" /LENGTH=207 /DNA_ID=CAMNT_0042625717 /DNA_START=35 /DNA_END=658 /DNA_ORIENTATION=+